MPKFHSITIDFQEKLILQKIYGEIECRYLRFEYETNLLAELMLLLVGHDGEKVKQAVEIVKRKLDSDLSE